MAGRQPFRAALEAIGAQLSRAGGASADGDGDASYNGGARDGFADQEFFDAETAELARLGAGDDDGEADYDPFAADDADGVLRVYGAGPGSDAASASASASASANAAAASSSADAAAAAAGATTTAMLSVTGEPAPARPAPVPPTPENVLAAFAEPEPLPPAAVAQHLADTAALTADDMLALVFAAITHNGLAGSAIRSFNAFARIGLPTIIGELFHLNLAVPYPRDPAISHIEIDVVFRGVNLTPPRHVAPGGQWENIFPRHARFSNTPYSGALWLGAKVTFTAVFANGSREAREASLPPFPAMMVPIIVGSEFCHTFAMQRDGRVAVGESPEDPGGYVLLTGQEFALQMTPSVRFNTPLIHRRIVQNEEVRCDFISQPGREFENSTQVSLRLHTDGRLTVQITSQRFRDLIIPWYILFRIFGMTSDREIAAQTLLDLDAVAASKTEQRLAEILTAAFAAPDKVFGEYASVLDREVLIEALAAQHAAYANARSAWRSDDNAVRYLNEQLMRHLDSAVLPHLGDTAAARPTKLRFLGYLIRQMLLVHLEVRRPTDRDSLKQRRVHDAGIGLAKAFKSMFNHALVTPLIAALRRLVAERNFHEITAAELESAFRSPFTTAAAELNRLLETSIRLGREFLTLNRRQLRNRLRALLIERRNPLNMLCALRAINMEGAGTASKSNERADLMRRVHATQYGYICPAHSPDTGEKVGSTPQLAITADICSTHDSGDAASLKLLLAVDPALWPVARCTNAQIAREQLVRIFVNGDWVACAPAGGATVAARYRRARRVGLLASRVSIHWNVETDEVEFWTDVGRFVRPLFVVDNNMAAVRAGLAAAQAAREAGDPDWRRHRVPFAQWLRYTRAVRDQLVTGAAGLADLVRAGIVDEITPDEAGDCIVAPDIATFQRAARDPCQLYTHCDVEQAMLGIAALVSPYAQCTQPVRVTYETNQGRQACGWYSLAFDARPGDQHRFFQLQISHALTPTFMDGWLWPSGLNAMVAYMAYGNNQEDSAVVSQDFTSRGGFAGVMFHSESKVLERNQLFRVPDPTATNNLNPRANYSKLGPEGFVPAGAFVEPNDVIIGCVTALPDEPHQPRRYADASVVYNGAAARVARVYTARNADGALMCTMSLCEYRKLGIGDKMSSREGNKCIVAVQVEAQDMPYDETGCRPDIIFSPHSLPTRMTVGQMIETLAEIVAALAGAPLDASPFRKFDARRLEKFAEGLGVRMNGLRRMFDPATGRPLGRAIFFGPTFMQRLLKFVLDERYVAGIQGPRDAVTRQPLDGRRLKGGLRLGEMENWVMGARALGYFLSEKLHAHSGGATCYFCRRCGEAAVFNRLQEVYACAGCGELAELAAVESTHAANAFRQTIRAANIATKVVLDPYKRYVGAP